MGRRMIYNPPSRCPGQRGQTPGQRLLQISSSVLPLMESSKVKGTIRPQTPTATPLLPWHPSHEAFFVTQKLHFLGPYLKWKPFYWFQETCLYFCLITPLKGTVGWRKKSERKAQVIAHTHGQGTNAVWDCIIYYTHTLYITHYTSAVNKGVTNLALTIPTSVTSPSHTRWRE